LNPRLELKLQKF